MSLSLIFQAFSFLATDQPANPPPLHPIHKVFTFSTSLGVNHSHFFMVFCMHQFSPATIIKFLNFYIYSSPAFLKNLTYYPCQCLLRHQSSTPAYSPDTLTIVPSQPEESFLVLLTPIRRFSEPGARRVGQVQNPTWETSFSDHSWY